ncbi:hypothetical protein Clacol_007182 [Clathrus columnatus]|uniref:MaoC-like domain-containing protein n=1 Tax=Clathrus columnatus TaxID=1419009 RepID=A0AAV5AJA0_9AGAM|nr:hypothetical protein Clacol_007182 [Clathrus columnatus]
MSFDLGKAVGHQYDDLPHSPKVSWNKRDLLIYAVGVGATKDDLNFVYGTIAFVHKNFSALPTYPVVLPFKRRFPNQIMEITDVVNFREMFGGRGKSVDGLPKFNPDRVRTTTESGIIVDQENSVISPSGEVYARMFTSSFNVGAKATGNPFNKVIASAPTPKAIPKDRKPSYVFTQTIPENQAAIYRLSGDYNALHIEPAIGMKAGFGGPILHGLCTFGFVARGIIGTVGGNDANSLKSFGCRFTSPVKLGDKLETSVWEVGQGPDGTTELVFATKNLNSGKLSLGAGIAFVKKTEKSKL